MISSSS